jgi:hypothetical protein
MINMTEELGVFTRTDRDLIQQIKEKYPETKGMTATGVIDWALRKLLEVKTN